MLLLNLTTWILVLDDKMDLQCHRSDAVWPCIRMLCAIPSYNPSIPAGYIHGCRLSFVTSCNHVCSVILPALGLYLLQSSLLDKGVTLFVDPHLSGPNMTT